MKIKSILAGILTLAIILLITGYYFMPFNEMKFVSGPINYNFSINGTLSAIQFYPNMRFETSDISYKIDSCNIKKQEEMRNAFDIMENLSVLNFNEVSENEDITITCDEKARLEGGMIIAGEGGPTRIVQSGGYNVIINGKILLIKSFDCPFPNVALHELFHVLGFIHSNNQYNIMYNYTSCKQTIGGEIPSLIDELYSVPNYPDLVLENASGQMSGRYMDINMTINNFGLKDSLPAEISIKIDDKLIKKIELDGLEIGSGKTITIQNLFVSKIELGDLQLSIDYPGKELNKENNILILGLV